MELFVIGIGIGGLSHEGRSRFGDYRVEEACIVITDVLNLIPLEAPVSGFKVVIERCGDIMEHRKTKNCRPLMALGEVDDLLNESAGTNR